MIYFTSDLHFYHENIIKSVNRPFKNAEQMNDTLIKNWNNKVQPHDEIYILGDFTMKGYTFATTILYQLKGKKHLIKGNHDKFADSPHFEKSLLSKEITINSLTVPILKNLSLKAFPIISK